MESCEWFGLSKWFLPYLYHWPFVRFLLSPELFYLFSGNMCVSFSSFVVYAWSTTVPFWVKESSWEVEWWSRLRIVQCRCMLQITLEKTMIFVRVLVKEQKTKKSTVWNAYSQPFGVLTGKSAVI